MDELPEGLREYILSMTPGGRLACKTIHRLALPVTSRTPCKTNEDVISAIWLFMEKVNLVSRSINILTMMHNRPFHLMTREFLRDAMFSTFCGKPRFRPYVHLTIMIRCNDLRVCSMTYGWVCRLKDQLLKIMKPIDHQVPTKILDTGDSSNGTTRNMEGHYLVEKGMPLSLLLHVYCREMLSFQVFCTFKKCHTMRNTCP